MSIIDTIQKRIKSGCDKGFTLIELLITVIVLGVLAGIVVFAVSGITDNSTSAACKSDKKNVEIASEAYFAQKKAFASGIGATGSTDTTTLVGSKLLREAPSNSGYTITYSATDGSVSATGC